MENSDNRVVLSTFFWEDESLLDVLPRCAEMGIDALELWGMEPHFRYRDHRFVSEVAAELGRLKIKPLSLHAPFRVKPSFEQYDISSEDEGHRRDAVSQVKGVIEAYLRIGGEKLVSIHPGGRIVQGEHKAERNRQCGRSLAELLTFCEKHDVRLAVENLPPGWVGDSIGDVVGIVSSFDSSRLGMCFDTSHANLTDPGFEKAVPDIPKATRQLFLIHASDNRGDKDEHLLPFDGTIRWEDLCGSLKRMRYKGTIILEVRNNPDIARVMTAARTLAEMRSDEKD